MKISDQNSANTCIRLVIIKVRILPSDKRVLSISLSLSLSFYLYLSLSLSLSLLLSLSPLSLSVYIYIISKQLDIKLGPFTQEELDSVLRKIKNRKAAGLDEIPPEVWKTRQFDDILLRHCNAVYNQNTIDRWMKGCILPFPKKGDLGLAKKYRGITLISTAAKIYNALQRNRIEPKIDNILRKNQNGFRRNRSTTSQILTIHRILEGVRAEKPTGDITICRLYQGLRFHSQRKDGTNPTSIRPT